MRAHGVLTEIQEADAADHVCWVYGEDDAAFGRAVRRFLAAGLERGERLLAIGERVLDSIGTDGDGFSGAAALISRGALRTFTTAQAYEATGQFAAAEQRTFYDAATRAAIADGYTGLRVVADVSDLAADPLTRPRLVQWEHLADGFIAEGAGFTAMCAYSAGLTDEALADVATVHPLVHAPAGPPPFQVFFDDRHIAVSGSVDTFSADRLARVLASSPVGAQGAVLDVSRVEFMDVAASRVIARWALHLDAHSLLLDVRGASPVLRRMWHVLALGELAPVTFDGVRFDGVAA
ncbi:STAS domain-containing protein [Blastococcus colisei]|uniref:STAS domain-containing protein n=1 Tax=Blastococcus colisei TaxID=1564162 RepID=A0A543PEY4_9ACTN|nr:MEDS domain-containing protein [Blastococcus colisei]TQN42640.1 STAS domain-containing protein [Blastococcus colisei]